ncbi:D-allose kinase [Serratia plymuthica]|nr:D-allose kinase [Serratia plymuthica]
MNILDPQRLILGGGVIAMAGFPLAQLEQEIRRHLRGPQPVQGLAISVSRLSDDTGGKGACLAAQRYFHLTGEHRQ